MKQSSILLFALLSNKLGLATATFDIFAYQCMGKDNVENTNPIELGDDLSVCFGIDAIGVTIDSLDSLAISAADATVDKVVQLIDEAVGVDVAVGEGATFSDEIEKFVYSLLEGSGENIAKSDVEEYVEEIADLTSDLLGDEGEEYIEGVAEVILGDSQDEDSEDRARTLEEDEDSEDSEDSGEDSEDGALDLIEEIIEELLKFVPEDATIETAEVEKYVENVNTVFTSMVDDGVLEEKILQGLLDDFYAGVGAVLGIAHGGQVTLDESSTAAVGLINSMAPGMAGVELEEDKFEVTGGLGQEYKCEAIPDGVFCKVDITLVPEVFYPFAGMLVTLEGGLTYSYGEDRNLVEGESTRRELETAEFSVRFEIQDSDAAYVKIQEDTNGGHGTKAIAAYSFFLGYAFFGWFI